MDEIREKALEMILKALKEASKEGTLRVKVWPNIGSVHLEGLSPDVAKLFGVL